MSVILAYKTKDKIYLCADNRTSTEEGTPISDDLQKIIVLNENVAVAFAGYSGSQTVFENMTKDIRDGKKNCRVEDILKILKVLYWICKVPWNKKYTKNFMRLSSRFIVAGKNKKDEYCIYTISFLNGKLEKPSLTDRFIFPPYDVSAKTSWEIYANNIVNSYSDFMQRTVKEIADMSDVVSHSGDIWVCDMITGKSTLKHFD